MEGICPPISINTTMASQDENQVANLIGSNAYYIIVNAFSVGLCYSELDSTWYYSLEHISLGFSVSLFCASLHVLRLVLSP